MDTSGVRFPPPLLYAAGFLGGVGLELAVPITGPPLVIAVLTGVFATGLWLALDGTAMARFRQAGTSMVPMRPSTALVTSGPYRFTRNPMYVGMAVLYAGLAVAFGVIWALATLPLVLVAVDRLVIAREERYQSVPGSTKLNSAIAPGSPDTSLPVRAHRSLVAHCNRSFDLRERSATCRASAPSGIRYPIVAIVGRDARDPVSARERRVR